MNNCKTENDLIEASRNPKGFLRALRVSVVKIQVIPRFFLRALQKSGLAEAIAPHR